MEYMKAIIGLLIVTSCFVLIAAFTESVKVQYISGISAFITYVWMIITCIIALAKEVGK